MIEIVASKDCDLGDIDRIISYVKRFVKDSDIEVDGRNIDGIFDKNSKLARLIERLGAEKVELQIAEDLESYGGVGVVIHTPDIHMKQNAVRNLSPREEEAEDQTNQIGNWSVEELEGLGIRMPKYTGGKTPIEEKSVLNYMSEQKVYPNTRPITEMVSFRDRFKPKTSKQLAELRSYGM